MMILILMNDNSQSKETDMIIEDKEVTVTDDEENTEEEEKREGDMEDENEDTGEPEIITENDLDIQLGNIMEHQDVKSHNLKKLGDMVLILGCTDHLT